MTSVDLSSFLIYGFFSSKNSDVGHRLPYRIKIIYYYFTEAGGKFGLGHAKRFEAICNILSSLDIRLVLNEASCLDAFAESWSNSKLCNLKAMINAADGIFVDSFIATESAFEIFQNSEKLVVIDDFLRREWKRGLIVDWTLDAERWRSSVGERSLFGVDYLATRLPFQVNKWSPDSSALDFETWTIGTIFGGVDSLALTEKTFNALAEHPSVIHFGTSAYPSYPLFRNNHRFLWDLGVDDLAKNLCRCDLVITAGGQTLYELASMGVPSLCVLTTDNQLEDFRAFVENRFTFESTPVEIISKGIVARLKGLRKVDLEDMSERCSQSMGDGKRLAQEIERYLCK
ncbi:MAG: hypothetical protein VW124_16865 [Paracoccaceae bacterium]